MVYVAEQSSNGPGSILSWYQVLMSSDYLVHSNRTMDALEEHQFKAIGGIAS